MKRVLVIDDLYSIGKIGGNISLPIFSSLCLESVLIPQTQKLSSLNPTVLCDLQNNYSKYISYYKDEMIHFDNIFYKVNYDTNLNETLSLINNLSFNDTTLICDNTDSSLLEKEEIYKCANIIILKEEDEEKVRSFSKKLSDKTSYILNYGIKVSEEKKAVAIYNRECKDVKYIYYKRWREDFINIPSLFSYTLAGFYINISDIEKAIRKTLSFITFCFSDYNKDANYSYYALDYEKKLPELKNLIQATL